MDTFFFRSSNNLQKTRLLILRCLINNALGDGKVRLCQILNNIKMIDVLQRNQVKTWIVIPIQQTR